jgi:alpha-glucosidase (family GH31 glycosyl hydrolase)
VEVEADVSQTNQQLVAYLFAEEPLTIVGQFTHLSGKPVLPPKWSFGPWMSSNNWDSQAEVLKQAELTAKYQIPSTVLVIEQWSDEATFYIFNDAQYTVKDGNLPFRYDEFQFPEWGRWPNPKGMVEELHEQGLKVLLWQIPIHKHMYGVAHGQRDQDEITLLEQGYCVKTADGEPYTLPYNWFKDCHILDFTNPEAVKWWFNKRRYLADEIGVDGFKTDGGEFVFGHDLQFFDGSTGREMRNLYPNLYVGSYYNFIGQHAKDGGITFSRAGYTGAQSYPMHWAGDERSTFQAFRSSMIAGLSSSMSGIPFWGWDLGGFHGDIPTAELFIRSTQMAAFCPVMQYHAETKGEFNQDRTPWNIAERTNQPLVIDLYKRYADIRMNLLPYIYDQAIRTSRTGLPMMRAMSLQFPADSHCTEMISEYMFGESLLVAPVTEEGHGAKEIYFPEGSWISLFDQEEVQGPCLMKVAAPLETIPVYQRQDSVIALNLAENYSLGDHVGNSVNGYEHLCFRVYVVGELEAEFEDDLGNHVTISAKRVGGQIRLDWSCSLSANQPITFILHQPSGVSVVTCSETELSPVDDLEHLLPGHYLNRHKNLLITVQEPAGSLVIAQ